MTKTTVEPNKRLNIVLTPAEFQVIAEGAAKTHLTVASYARMMLMAKMEEK